MLPHLEHPAGWICARYKLLIFELTKTNWQASWRKPYDRRITYMYIYTDTLTNWAIQLNGWWFPVLQYLCSIHVRILTFSFKLSYPDRWWAISQNVNIFVLGGASQKPLKPNTCCVAKDHSTFCDSKLGSGSQWDQSYWRCNFSFIKLLIIDDFIHLRFFYFFYFFYFFVSGFSFTWTVNPNDEGSQQDEAYQPKRYNWLNSPSSATISKSPTDRSNLLHTSCVWNSAITGLLVHDLCTQWFMYVWLQKIIIFSTSLLCFFSEETTQRPPSLYDAPRASTVSAPPIPIPYSSRQALKPPKVSRPFSEPNRKLKRNSLTHVKNLPIPVSSKYKSVFFSCQFLYTVIICHSPINMLFVWPGNVKKISFLVQWNLWKIIFLLALP